jgi:hypothetical protein
MSMKFSLLDLKYSRLLLLVVTSYLLQKEVENSKVSYCFDANVPELFALEGDNHV